MKKIIALLFTLFAAALITSCNLSLTENKTAIKLTLPKSIGSSGARQAYSQDEIDYYDIFCQPLLDEEYFRKLEEEFWNNYTPGTYENENGNLETYIYKMNNEFQHRYAELTNVKPGETVTITELLEGKYEISITGYDKKGNPIAWGYSEEIDLVANETTTVTVKMTLVEKYDEPFYEEPIDDPIEEPEEPIEYSEEAITFNLTATPTDSGNRYSASDFKSGVALVIEKNNFLKFQNAVLKDLNPYDPVAVESFMNNPESEYIISCETVTKNNFLQNSFILEPANLNLTDEEYYLYILGITNNGTICLQGNTAFKTSIKEYNLTYYFLTAGIPLTINYSGNIAEKLTSIVTNESTSQIDLNNITISGCIKLWNETCDKLIETYALPIDLQEIITAVLMDDSTNNSINSSMTIYLDSSAFTSGQKYNVLLQVYATGNNLNLINKSYIESFVYNNGNNSVFLTLK